MNNEYLDSAREKMDKAIKNLVDKFTTVRAGRANPSMLDGVSVDYYNTPTAIKQLATISVPEARQISIKPFDRTLLGAIEKAIFEANIGVTPNNNGEVIFITIPPLTEERRKELVKQIKEYAEEGKIAIRNIRRDIIEKVKADKLPEDIEKSTIDLLQDVVGEYNKKVDEETKLKEKDLMEI